MESLHVKFHDDRCKGKAVMRQKPKCGRQTDGVQTDGHGDSSIPPLTSLRGGYNNIISSAILCLLKIYHEKYAANAYDTLGFGNIIFTDLQ